MKPSLLAVLVLVTSLAAPAWADVSSDLIMAAYRGDTAGAKRLLAKGARVDARDENGYTPLHWAAYQGKPTLAKLLLDKGAAIDALDREGHTPLMLAAWQGHPQVATMLLIQGADRAARSKDGYNAADFAASRGHVDLVRLLTAPMLRRSMVAPIVPSPAASPSTKPTARPTASPSPVPRPTPRPTAAPMTPPPASPVPSPIPLEEIIPSEEPLDLSIASFPPLNPPSPSPTPTPAPSAAGDNELTLVAGAHLSKASFPILGVHVRRTLLPWVSARVGYEQGRLTQPSGTSTLDLSFSRVSGALLTNGNAYGGLGLTWITLGSLTQGGTNPSRLSYDAIAGLRVPLGAFGLGVEFRFGIDGPSTATFGGSARF